MTEELDERIDFIRVALEGRIDWAILQIKMHSNDRERVMSAEKDIKLYQQIYQGRYGTTYNPGTRE